MIKDFIDNIAKKEEEAEKIIINAKVDAEKIDASFEASYESLKNESAKRIREYNKALEFEYNKKAEIEFEKILKKANIQKEELLTKEMNDRLKIAEELVIKKIKEYGNR